MNFESKINGLSERVEKDLDWPKLIQANKIKKISDEELSQKIYQSYFESLQDGGEVNFNIPRENTKIYPAMPSLIRAALEKRFGQEENWFSMSVIVSELLNNALDHGQGEKIDLDFKLSPERFFFSVHDKARDILTIEQKDDKFLIRFQSKGDDRVKKYPLINKMINDAYEVIKIESTESAVEQYKLLSKKSCPLAEEQTTWEETRGRGLCVMAGYMQPTDELILKIYPDKSISLGINKNRQASEQFPEIDLSEIDL